MIDSVLYLCAFGLFITGCLLYPKTDNKINFVTGFMLSYVTALCYGAAGALLFTFAHIPVYLVSISALYFTGGVILLSMTIKKHSVQKYLFRMFDLWVIIAAILLFGRLAVYIFSRHVNINYANMPDSGNHFCMTMEAVRDKGIGGMYFTALFHALFIEILWPLVPETWSYKLFILSDCYHNLMELFFFYGFMLHINKDRNKWLPVIVTFLYWCGYPFYSFADGAYIYWGMGAVLVQYVVFMLSIYENNIELRRICLMLVMLGCYGVTVCYIEFLPAVILTVAAMIIYTRYRENSFQLDKNVKIILVSLAILLAVCAVTGYHFIFKPQKLDIFEVLMLGTNENKSLEIVISVPIILYIVNCRIREKRINAYLVTLFGFLAVQTGFTLLASVNKMSSYYLFKPYFIFWSLIWMIILCDSWRFKGKVRTYTVNYLIVAAAFLMFSYAPQKEGDAAFYGIDNSIWRNNAMVMQYDFRNSFFNKETMDMIDDIYYNYAKNNIRVAMISTNTHKGMCAWYNGITNLPVFWHSPLTREDIEAYLEEDKPDYILVFYDSDAYEENEEYFETFEKVSDNGYGFIAKVKH